MRKPDNVPESGPVIVGVDGSERSVEALALADLLGPALGRREVIAYVHPYGKHDVDQRPPAPGSRRRSLRTRCQHSNQTSTAVRRWWMATPERLACEAGDLDLLVVGSGGYGPLRAVLLGSISSALVRSAKPPLVVVPRGADGESAPQGTTSPRRMA